MILIYKLSENGKCGIMIMKNCSQITIMKDQTESDYLRKLNYWDWDITLILICDFNKQFCVI